MARLNPAPRKSGFSLIELLTVITILGILAAIAMPNYREYLLRSKLVDAASTLAQLRVGLEQYYQDNRNYDAAPNAPAGACGGADVAASNSKYFTYSCATSDSGQAFTVIATGTAAGGTAGFAFSVDQGNNRKTTALPSDWGTAPVSCWITAKGQAC